MLSLTSQYALRALIHLALHTDDRPVPGRRLAEEAGIPAKYLSKVLGDLVRAGVLDSSPGKTGGYRLRRPAQETMLYDVLAPFEQFDRRRCPFGNQECSDEHPCLAHNRWKHVVGAQQAFLRETSVRDVAIPEKKKRRRSRKKKPS